MLSQGRAAGKSDLREKLWLHETEHTPLVGGSSFLLVMTGSPKQKGEWLTPTTEMHELLLCSGESFD